MIGYEERQASVRHAALQPAPLWRRGCQHPHPHRNLIGGQACRLTEPTLDGARIHVRIVAPTHAPYGTAPYCPRGVRHTTESSALSTSAARALTPA